MPIYEFSCRNCGICFETLVSLGAEKKVVCTGCGSQDIRKLISSFGIGGGSDRTKTAGSSCAGCTATSCSTCK
ncbi:MAG: zinc ribbon domain-containing protein [Candidatus Aminicenantes bacterium]|nr:zinc ribbon domain-containing protein [Candidatus Aminicenantes bacterium]